MKYQSDTYLKRGSQTEHFEKQIQDVKVSEYKITRQYTESGAIMSATVVHPSVSQIEYDVIILMPSNPDYVKKCTSSDDTIGGPQYSVDEQSDHSIMSLDGSVDGPQHGESEQMNTSSDDIMHDPQMLYRQINMSCTCGKPVFLKVCDHIIAFAKSRSDEDILRSLDHLPGPAQRMSQHRLYNSMTRVPKINFVKDILDVMPNVFLPRVAMQTAGAPSKKPRKKKFHEKFGQKFK